MMIQAQAEEFAQEWIAAWNAHDLSAVARLYSEDFEMSSPFVAQLTGEPSGRLVGKEQVQAYWEAVFRRMPLLNFELLDVFAGASSLVVHYRTNLGRDAAEVLFFDSEGKIYRAAAHFKEQA